MRGQHVVTKSRPISRILSLPLLTVITIHLDLQLLADSSDLPDSSVRAAHYLLGLASGGVYIANCITAITGGLLHRRFTLTNIAIGGLLSVALSRGLLRVGVTHHLAL